MNGVKAHRRPTVDLSKEIELVEQGHAESCDINITMARWGGVIPPPPANLDAFYGDFSTAVDFQTALNAVRTAEAEFQALPAPLRHRFNHDPAELIAFLDDEANALEAAELGLLAQDHPQVVDALAALEASQDPAAVPDPATAPEPAGS